MKIIRSSLGCCLLLSTFLQVFVEARILSLSDTNGETQNLVTSVDADDKIAKLEPFVKLINSEDEDDVADDEDDYDDIEGGDAKQSFVKLVQEVYNNYVQLEDAYETDQRHARLTPKEEPERFSRLITDDEFVDGSVDEDGDNEVKETLEEDDDFTGEDSKFVKKLKRHHRRNKAAKGKGRKCGRKCRGKGKGRKQNLVTNDDAENKIARLEPFVKLINPHKEEEEVTDADYDYDIEGEDAEPSFAKLIQDVYNSYVSQEDDNENDQRIARLTPNEEATRFSKLITDEDEVELNGSEVEKPDQNGKEVDEDVTDVESKLVQKLKRHHNHRRNKAAKGKGRKCGKKCGGRGKGRKPNWRQIVKKLKLKLKKLKLKDATNERRKKKKFQQRHKNAAKEIKRCPRSSKVCCDGNAPNFDGDKSTPACKDGGKPQCSLEDCKYTLLEAFATWF